MLSIPVYGGGFLISWGVLKIIKVNEGCEWNETGNDMYSWSEVFTLQFPKLYSAISVFVSIFL